MKHAQYNQYGNPFEVVELVESPSKSLEPGQVRLSLEVANINPADLFVIQGSYPIRPSLPTIPGNGSPFREAAISSYFCDII